MFNFFKKSPNEDQPNIKSHPLSVDAFLFNCMETQKAKHLEGSQSSIEWPTLQDLNPEELKEEFGSQKIEEIFSDLASWYVANFPVLNDSTHWQSHMSSEICTALLCLFNDLQRVYKIKFDSELPPYNLDNKIWAGIESIIDKLFAEKKTYFDRFIHWRFGGTDAEKPKYGNERKPRNNNGRDRDSRRKEQSRNSRPPLSEEEKLERAMSDCKRAIDQLKSRPEEPCIVLRPKNSYYRRLQHNYIVEQGFYSESKGEGRDRAVVIYRDKDLA
jgi:hypothetical protein